MGGSAVETVGIASVESSDFHRLGLGRGERIFSISMDRSTLKIVKLGHLPVNSSQVIDFVTLSGGIGLTEELSLWGQMPLAKNREEKRWSMGDPAFGLRWRPFAPNGEPAFIMYVNEGLVVPLDKSPATNSQDSPAARIKMVDTSAGGRVYLSRTVSEIWINSKNAHSFGLQLLWDLPLRRIPDGINPGQVVQLSLHTIDHRFAGPGLVPYLALVYRRESPDNDGGRKIENSDGWFISGIGAMTIRVGKNYRATVSISGPLMIGIDGAELHQLNVGLRFSTS